MGSPVVTKNIVGPLALSDGRHDFVCGGIILVRRGTTAYRLSPNRDSVFNCYEGSCPDQGLLESPHNGGQDMYLSAVGEEGTQWYLRM